MSPEDRQLTAIGGAICAAAGRIDAWSRPLALLALAALLLPQVTAASAAALAASVLLGLLEGYCALRLAFDRPLFAHWADAADEDTTSALAAFDTALNRLGWPVGDPGRPLAARVAGARALLLRQGQAFAAQWLAASSAVLLLSLH
ncbi:hypothetical protein [Azonexus sp.]|uniref:hypothetical protein n=1 Tax=Azonexus sp. TaxID=1872668 RepID=UPI0035AE011E